MSAAVVAALQFYNERKQLMRLRTATKKAKKSQRNQVASTTKTWNGIDDDELSKLAGDFMKEKPDLARALAKEVLEEEKASIEKNEVKLGAASFDS